MSNKILAAIIILAVSNQISYSSDIYHSPRRIEGTYSFEILGDQKNLIDEKKLEYWLPIPGASESQKNIEFTIIEPKPVQFVKLADGNQKIAYWNCELAKDPASFQVKVQISADLYKVDHFVDPDMVPDEPAPYKNLASNYLQSDSLAFITPEISELAKELTRSVTDPFLKARNIYRWILVHLDHQFPIQRRGTRHLFANPTNVEHSLYEGDSAEYSWVFIAMCRAVGVPARSVTGFLVKPGSELPHTWAEFFLPNWGWLPADPYLADSNELLQEFSDQSDESYYLGHLDNYHLAFYKGSGFALQPETHFDHSPFIRNHQVWYAPIGIWNFDRFPNASANLMVTFEALLIKKYQKPQYGIELEFPENWLHQSETELGPYLLKDKFLTLDRSVKLDFLGRKLPSAYQEIDAKDAAQLEITALTKANPDYQIVSEQSLTIGADPAYQFSARIKIDGKPTQEYRVYVAKQGYLFWLIGSSNEPNFKRAFKKFQAVARSLKLNLPESLR